MSECELCGTVLANGVCVKCLTSSRDKWKADAMRLAQGYSYDDDEGEDIIQCVHCLAYVQNKNAKSKDIEHFPGCPITLHQLLIEEEKK